MENNLSGTIFVEFYGLSGCGKSTISHAVSRRLREDGFSVSEPSFSIDHRKPLVRRIIKLMVFLWWYLFHHKYYAMLNGISRKNGYRGSEALTQTLNLIQKLRVYRKPSSKIVIWDQGLVQAAISLSVNEKITAYQNLMELLTFVPKNTIIHRILLPVDVKTALMRMYERHSTSTRVDKLGDDESKLELLKVYEKEIKTISEGFGKTDEFVVRDSEDKETRIEDSYKSIKEKCLR